MAWFATVDDVRLRAGLEVAAVADEVVEVALDDAHGVVEAALAPEVETSPAPDLVVAAEALLAGACVLRALAGRAAAEHRTVRVGGQSVERGRQAVELLAMAARYEAEAWDLLAPFCAGLPAHPVEVTATVAILGDRG